MKSVHQSYGLNIFGNVFKITEESHFYNAPRYAFVTLWRLILSEISVPLSRDRWLASTCYRFVKQLAVSNA